MSLIVYLLNNYLLFPFESKIIIDLYIHKYVARYQIWLMLKFSTKYKTESTRLERDKRKLLPSSIDTKVLPLVTEENRGQKDIEERTRTKRKHQRRQIEGEKPKEYSWLCR